jgi:hypothetical protein
VVCVLANDLKDDIPILYTHRPESREWCDLSGLITSHVLHHRGYPPASQTNMSALAVGSASPEFAFSGSSFGLGMYPAFVKTTLKKHEAIKRNKTKYAEIRPATNQLV